MKTPFQDAFHSLVGAISAISGVISIGKSGGKALPGPNDGDIDLFIFCREIPSAEKRRKALHALGDGVSDIKAGESKEKFWGYCDFALFQDTEICCMYFTAAEMSDEIEHILKGGRLERESEYFYPTGRCASLLSAHILLDRGGYLAGLKNKLSVYPQALAELMVYHHVQKINDAEDFKRALAREDVLFYHATLESALDHYLQALFALNRCFFPSRKRTLQFIDGFSAKPEDCAGRLLRAITLGANPCTLSQSYEVWAGLCKDLLALIG